MDKRVIITSIEIISEKKTKLLSEYEIKEFCEKKVQINVTESVADILMDNANENSQNSHKSKVNNTINFIDL